MTLPNIFVASDGSTDATADVVRAARRERPRAQPQPRQGGRAGGRRSSISDSAERFEVVLLLDADTHLAPDYLESALPLFDDPEVVAVAGRATTIDDAALDDALGRFLLAYRERLYVVVQYCSSTARRQAGERRLDRAGLRQHVPDQRALRDIDIDAPGLVIEDFNMTFEVHAKRLGRIAFRPGRRSPTPRTPTPATTTSSRCAAGCSGSGRPCAGISFGPASSGSRWWSSSSS